MIRKTPAFFTFVLLGMLAACSSGDKAADCSQLLIQDAWIREAPPGVQVMAGYMRLSNKSTSDITISSALSPSFKAIEFHLTEQENGSMKMQRLSALQVPAGEELLLESGGMHLMLFNPAENFIDGDNLSIELRCATTENVRADFLVKRSGGDAQQQPHH